MGKTGKKGFGEKGRRRVKQKSIKSKATGKSVGSKRRLARMGKKQKKGHSGIAATYMTRNQALKKLQITLRDFRRLCILRGIHPRDPSKKAGGHDKTYYHVKDISFLQHEPLLHKFREFKTFMKKVRHAAGRTNHKKAREMYARKPEYRLDHVVKDRYPTFEGALADLDDAICMVNMFAMLPAEKGGDANDRIERCRMLSKQWQYYCVHSHVLRKAFVSVKGIYYQAEIKGSTVTWVVPHMFTQDRARDVDFRVMLTFLEFYDVLLQFCLFKLYHDAGLQYPPKMDEAADEAGANLGSLHVTTLGSSGTGATSTTTSMATNSDGASEDAKAARAQVKASEARLASLGDKLEEIGEGAADEDDEAEGEEDKTAGDGEEDEAQTTEGGVAPLLSADVLDVEDAFKDSDEAKAVRKQTLETVAFQKLFKGYKFFFSRECPRESLEFAARAFSAECGWEGPSSPFDVTDPDITHQIVDRPVTKAQKAAQDASREYVQPQWIYDSINARLVLPVARYLQGAELPPHLSPFVDDRDVGYVPEYRAELDKLQAAAGLKEAADVAVTEEGTPVAETEVEELAKSMMSKKDRRLHGRIMHARKRKFDANESLREKRKMLKQSK